MKLITVLLSSLFILLFSSCKDAVGSHHNPTAEDILGDWLVTYRSSSLSLTTAVTTDIVDPVSPGTGLLLINGQDVGLRYVNIINGLDFSRIDTLFDGIEIRNYPLYEPGANEDIWYYVLNRNSDSYSSTLSHTWGHNPRVTLQSNSSHPNFSFSNQNFFITLEDTLIQHYGQTIDTFIVAGNITPATLHLRAGQPVQVMSTGFEVDIEYFSFDADGTFGHWVGMGPTETGIWSLDDGLLQMNFDIYGNENIVEVTYQAYIVNDQLSLHYLGDACETPDLPPWVDCYTFLASQYWPLERNDISEAIADNMIEMVRDPQPADPGD